MRGVYTAGVLDFFMDADIWLSHCYGVSAGAVNATNYLSKQRGRTFRITANYINDKRYFSVNNLLTTGNMFGADFLYNRIPNELDAFDYDTFQTSNSQMTAVVTNVDTGKPEYRQLTDLRWDMALVKSLLLPTSYFQDGGITDSIPLEKSIKDGNCKNIVVLTQHDGYQKQPEGGTKLIGNILYAKYRETLKAGKERHLMYNRQLELVKEQERLGKALMKLWHFYRYFVMSTKSITPI